MAGSQTFVFLGPKSAALPLHHSWPIVIIYNIFWPLLVYEVPITIMESFERKISQFLLRWLCLPQSLTSIALLGTTPSCSSSVAQKFKFTQTKDFLLYKDSTDTKVSSSVEIRTRMEVECAGSRLS